MQALKFRGSSTANTSESEDRLREALRGLREKRITGHELTEQAATAVLVGLRERGSFHHQPERRDFESACFFDRVRCRLERVRSDAFLAWLSDWIQVNRTDRLFKSCFAAIEGECLSDRATALQPEYYWTRRGEAIYLSQGDHKLVRITPGNVAVLDNGADHVVFAAGRTLAPWALVEKPERPRNELFDGASYANEHGHLLFYLYLYSLPTNPRTKPPLCIVGPVRSGKTRLAVGIAELLGLPACATKAEERGEDGFWPALDGGGLYILDNADTEIRWLADALAAAATDGSSRRRKKYTDNEEVTLRARAWTCITSANPSFASDAGLADRLLILRLQSRQATEGDGCLSGQLSHVRDAALSHIAWTLAAALQDTAPTPRGLNARHPEFADFAVRIGRALGCEDDAVAALKRAEGDKSQLCLENDPVGAAVLSFVGGGMTLRGSAASCLEQLQKVDPQLQASSPKRLARSLSNLWPHLAGRFRVERQVGHGGAFVYMISPPGSPMEPQDASPTSAGLAHLTGHVPDTRTVNGSTVDDRLVTDAQQGGAA